MRTYIKILFIFIVLLSICKNGSSQPHNAFSFDGVNDYLYFDDKPHNRLFASFTIQFWMKSNDLNTTNKYILAKNSLATNQYGIIYEYTQNQLEFFSVGHFGDNPRTGSQISITDSDWHHIAYTYDGVNLKGYKDGAEEFSVAKYFTLPMVNGSWFVAAASSTAGSNSNINIDEISIWDRALCEGEVFHYIGCDLKGSEPGLVALYDFDYGVSGGNNTSITSIMDKTSYANHIKIPSLAIVPLTGTTSNFVATLNYGFASPNSACVDYYHLWLIIDGYNSPICANTPLNLNTLGEPPGFVSYEWSTGATTSGITVSPTVTTIYKVTGTESDGCKTTASETVVVNSSNVSMSQITDSLKTNSSNINSFQWLDCNQGKQVIPGETNSYIKGIPNNSYALVTENTDGCIDTSACILLQPAAGSMDFDGGNDDIKLNDISTTRITNNFTIEFWFKFTVTGLTNKYMLTRNNGTTAQWAIIYGFAANKIEFFSSGGHTGTNPRTNSGITVNDAKWHHLAYTYNNATFKGYLDGNLIFSNNISFSLSSMPGVNWYLASNGVNIANNAFMKMDELRIWNYARDNSQINASLNCTLEGNETGLVAYYDFNSGYINSDNRILYDKLIDKTAHANHGILNTGIKLTGSDSNWSDGIVNANCLTVLPIELQSFSCQNINSDNTQLTWVTASEKNTSHFEIEKSFDGINFKTIGKVNSIKESYQTQHYIFNDVEQDAHNDFSYYRLKMVDQDNTFKYSEICSTNENIESSKSELMIYPNPANTFLFIRYKKESINDLKFLKLTNIRGDEVHVLYDYHEDGIRLNVANIDAGMYFVFVNSNNANHQLRFIKQN